MNDKTDATQQPAELDEASQNSTSRVVIPVWVGLAALLVVLLIGAVIIREISGPLSDLFFSGDPEIPVPEGAELIEEYEGGSASKEWLYHSDLTGCEIAEFYAEQEGAECSFGPFVCTEDVPDSARDINVIGRCSVTETDNISGYTWNVDITEYRTGGRQWTSFRIFLYDQRN